MRRFIQISSLCMLVSLILSSCGPPAYFPWLTAHNKYRCMHGVAALQWDTDLADVAAWRTANCSTCNHCTCQGASCDPKYSKQRTENATCWSASPQEAVDAWYSEVTKYDYNNPQYTNATGHFINIVVSSATKVGCACNSIHCYCDYDSAFGTTSAALKAQVFPKVKTEAQCTNP